MKEDRRSTSTSSASATLERSSSPARENADGIPLEAIAQRAYELYVASGPSTAEMWSTGSGRTTAEEGSEVPLRTGAMCARCGP